MSKTEAHRNSGVEEATEQERQEIREEYDRFGVKRKNSGGTKRLHIPNDDETDVRCRTPHGTVMFKEKSKIPPGYWPMCKNCMYHWRMD